jgi:hypothetical protein
MKMMQKKKKKVCGQEILKCLGNGEKNVNKL